MCEAKGLMKTLFSEDNGLNYFVLKMALHLFLLEKKSNIFYTNMLVKFEQDILKLHLHL